MDKSSHGSEDCATAMKKLIGRLEAAGLDNSGIKFFVITCDSGGGGAVQYIDPCLKAISVMTELSKKDQLSDSCTEHII